MNLKDPVFNRIFFCIKIKIRWILFLEFNAFYLYIMSYLSNQFIATHIYKLVINLKPFIMKKYLSLINKVILMALTFLGFSCDPNEPGVEYGMPAADFKIKGNIVDEVTQEKLNNIQVIFNDALSSTFNFDTTDEYNMLKKLI